MNNKEKGDFGEKVAVNYLLSKGAKILEKLQIKDRGNRYNSKNGR